MEIQSENLQRQHKDNLKEISLLQIKLLFTSLRLNLLLTQSKMLQKCFQSISLTEVFCDAGGISTIVLKSMISGVTVICQIHSSFLSDDEEYLGLSSSIRLIKSGFSRHPSQFSSQSLRIFFRSRTLSFFKSTVFKSICLSTKRYRVSWLRTVMYRYKSLTKLKITDLIVFLFELLADFIGRHRPAQRLRYFS